MARVVQLKHVDSDRYLTVDEAAEKLGIKPTAVRNYLYDGKMKTYKFKTLTLLSTDDIEAWAERKQKA